jgi:Ku C terminal domain like
VTSTGTTAYRCLADTAGAVGAGDPTPWALTVLHERVAQQPAYAPELIAILLAIGRDEQAWLAGLEHRQRIGERRWLSLLERRGASHPADVIGPYQDMVERYIRDSTDKRRYRRAVALLPALRAAYTATGNPAAFLAYMADLRLRHKRRPTFLKTLDAASV